MVHTFIHSRSFLENHTQFPVEDPGEGTDPPSPYLRVWMTGLPLISRTGSGTDSRRKWAKSIPVKDCNGTKTLHFEAAHTYMAYIREYSPRGWCMGFPSIKSSYAHISWLALLRVVQALKVIMLPLPLSAGVMCCPPFKFREEGEIGWKSREEGDLLSCTSPLHLNVVLSSAYTIDQKISLLNHRLPLKKRSI